MKKKALNRILSMMMVLTLVLGILPINAWAVDHTHDASCGYYPATPGTPCDRGCSEIVDGEIYHDRHH